jgi:hypothetical protein
MVTQQSLQTGAGYSSDRTSQNAFTLHTRNSPAGISTSSELCCSVVTDGAGAYRRASALNLLQRMVELQVLYDVV